MQARQILSLDTRVSLGVFIVVFAVYVVTLCPTIYPGPSAEAVCAVNGVGLKPPITHPLWTILGKFLSRFSSNTAYMLNIMSALFGSLAVALLYSVLSRFSHTRTAEEDARFQTQPYLRQLTALSGALLVAFSYPFWEGSLLAGADTLNAFFLVLLVFLVGRYVKTSKARYVMVFGLVYGLAITNYPTLLLLAPIFVVFFLVRARAILDDPVAVVATFVLFGVGLLPALYEPSVYALRGKDYVVHHNTFGQATSAFFDSYFRGMKNLFLQRSTFQDWIFWLFLPTFVPIVFFMMKPGGYDRGSDLATWFTYGVRYLFVLLFTVGGLGYLWGFFIGPVGMAGLDFLRHSRYLGSYVIVGAWFSYVLGYWIIVLTGKFQPTGTEPEPKVRYYKLPYLATAVIVLGLPAAEIAMNYQKSSKRHARCIEDFVKGVLKSSPNDAIFVVPVEPYFGSIGAPLRYFQSQMETSPAQGKTIVDLNAAFLDFYREKHIETARYLAETVVGRTVPEPRRLFLPEQPFMEVYDGILRCEALRAEGVGERSRPVCSLHNNFFSSPFLVGNVAMNRGYRAEPAGLLYVYRGRLEYRDRSAAIRENANLWNTLVLPEKRPRRKESSEIEEYIFDAYSKSANDFGVFCQLSERLDLAERYYRKALTFSPDNTSAMWNLASLMKSGKKNGEADSLFRRYESLISKQREEETDLLEKFGIALDFGGLVDTEEQLAAQEGAQAEAQRLAVLRLAAQIMPDNPRVRERIGDILSTAGEASVEEARSEYLAALERSQTEEREGTRRILGKLGRVYARLERNAEAESFLKQALSDDDPSTQTDLMEFYLATNQNALAVTRLAGNILDRLPKDEEENKTLAPFKSKAAVMMASVLLNSGEAEQAKVFLTSYLDKRPEQVDILLTLSEQLLRNPNFDSFTTWLFEKYMALQKTIPAGQLPDLADLYLRQKRYDAVIAMKEVPGPEGDLARFYRLKALAYEKLGKNTQAEETYRRAMSLVTDDRSYFATSLSNDLAWRLFNNGNVAEAQKLAREALTKNPTDLLVWDTYGWILYKTGGDFDEAFELIERSHLANPEIGIIAYHYGKLLLEKGLKARGAAVLERAVQTGIEGRELDDAREILKGR